MSISKTGHLGLPQDSVLQVKQAVILGTFSTGNTSFTDIDDGSGNVFKVLITPKSASSKILILLHCPITMGDAGGGFTLVRGSTEIFQATSASNRQRFTATGMYGIDESQYSGGTGTSIFLDSPGVTSELTYKPQVKIRATNVYVGRSVYDIDNDNASRHTSSITAMEIAG